MRSTQYTVNMLERLKGYLNTFDWNELTKSKQVILESFLRVATLEGISNVSMRSLASAAGVKPPTIYFHFPEGREQILCAALRWHYNNFAQALCDAVQECRTPEDYWSALITFHVSQQLRRPENDMWDALIATDRIAKVLPEALRSEVDDWEDFCDHMYFAVAQDLVGADCPRNARALRKLVDTIGAWWHWDGSEEDLDRAVGYVLNASEKLMR
ncbi:MAG: TetR/AcrR family transcriptional regulator [Candidatus Pseudomonas phytovorans]|uniref:TetR/AcrR family transcriptional regulator n=1 Tax=Candidatus Pseudomonas phytovorans TaxID=3121377 RepID=A0AAJ5WFW4_9PSED|nr:TetR/AcrR family transcriptional regulator [Pseudomonas sp.]WEK29656.1 MAG: TetR/AcrR family transcriptional regulator [Pseudomonas sp.]